MGPLTPNYNSVPPPEAIRALSQGVLLTAPRRHCRLKLMDSLSRTDPEISLALSAEIKRQQDTINLIASENHASSAVLAAQGSSLNDKYAEGYPGKRYYGGCQNIDTVESLAIARAKELFRAEHANALQSRDEIRRCDFCQRILYLEKAKFSSNA